MDADIKARFNQLMGRSLAQEAMIQTLLGMFADKTADWGDTLDNLRLTAEGNLKSLRCDGPGGDAIRSEALDCLKASLDDLHDGLLRGLDPKQPLMSVLRVRSIDYKGIAQVYVKKDRDPEKYMLPAEARELADEAEARDDLEFARRLRFAAHLSLKRDYRDVE
jgi:hypothetical protein